MQNKNKQSTTNANVITPNAENRVCNRRRIQFLLGTPILIIR